MVKLVVGVVAFVVVMLAFSFIESEADKDMEEKRKEEGPQTYEEDEFE